MIPKIPVGIHTLKLELKKYNFLNNKVIEAINLASKAHQQHHTKDGESFLEHHLFPVVYSLVLYYPQCNQRVITIALLHDILEDCKNITFAVIAQQFGNNIARAVDLLTRKKSNSNYSAIKYINLIKNADQDIRTIKIMDRIINLELVERIKKTHPEKFNNYLLETRNQFLPLAKTIQQPYYSYIINKLSELERS